MNYIHTDRKSSKIQKKNTFFDKKLANTQLSLIDLII